MRKPMEKECPITNKLTPFRRPFTPHKTQINA